MLCYIWDARDVKVGFWNDQVGCGYCVRRLLILPTPPKLGHIFKARLCEEETFAASGLTRIASGWSLLLIS